MLGSKNQFAREIKDSVKRLRFYYFRVARNLSSIMLVFLLIFSCFNFVSVRVYAQTAVANLSPDAQSVFGNSSASQELTTINNPSGPAGPLQNKATNNKGTTNLSEDAQSVFGNSSASQELTTIVSPADTSLVQQSAENNVASYSYLEQLLNFFGLTSDENEVSEGIAYFYDNTIVKWLTGIGDLLSKYLKQFIVTVITPIVTLLVNALVQFAYNPDVSVGKDQFSTSVRAMFRLVQDLSNDLLLIFFILSIWRYWANATFGSGGLMGAVGRIIVAVGTIIAWPTLYHYVILISNSAADLFLKQISQNPKAISDIVSDAIINALSFQGTLNFLSSTVNSGDTLSAILGTLPIAFFEIVLVGIIAVAIISSFVVFFAMKIIQIAMIVAAFLFAPFFLLFLVSPDTDGYASNFIKTFVECTLWTFVWCGFLVLLINLLKIDPNSIQVNGVVAAPGNTASSNPQNPWFVLFLVLGILQAMIQVPGYLSRAKLSEASSFLELYGLKKMAGGLGAFAFGPAGVFSKAYRAAKRNLGGESASMSLGGAGSLPVSAGAAKLQSFNQGLASVLGAGSSGIVGPGGLGSPRGIVTPGPVVNPDGDIRPGLFSQNSRGAQVGSAIRSNAAPGILGAMTSNALSQLGSSLSSGQSGSDSYSSGSYSGGASGSGAGGPVLSRQAIAWNQNPYHNLHGRGASAAYVAAEYTFKKLRPGSVDLEENKEDPNNHRIDFDNAGKIQKIAHRQGADASEIGMLTTVAALASMDKDGHGQEDPRAASAASNAVKDAHRYDPPLARKFGLWLSGGKAPAYHQKLEAERLEKEKAKARISGAMSYVRGEKGNHYTKFLRWKLGGPFQESQREAINYMSNNPESIMGGFNAGTETAFNTINRGGLNLDDITWGAASHPAIIEMQQGQKLQAIPAVAQLVNTQLAELGFGPNMNPALGNMRSAAVDAIYSSLSHRHIRAAVAISDIAGGISSVTPRMVNQVLQIHWNNGFSERPQGYERAVNLALGRNPGRA